jgi:Family of unknown function (DUF6519)
MSSDRTRISYDKDRQYRSVVAQQGRVTLESDWNESQVIVGEEARAEALDFVGSSGTPDKGYEIVANNLNPNAPFDFSIGKGTMYVGGIRTSLDRDINYSQQNEKLDWLDRDPNSFPAWVDSTTLANPDLKTEFIYLYLQEQETSAVEDTALKEIALGGPDTTQRTRLIQKIVRLGVKENDCGTALNIAKEAWAKQGLIFNDRTMRLESSTKLKVSFQPPTIPPDLCEPEARGGYLEAENQLIRVKISAGGKLIWGYDNASFLYRTKLIGNKKLELQSRPVDEKHQPKKDKFVEILRSAVDLKKGDYIAQSNGIFRLATDYDPDNKQVTLQSDLPANYPNDPQLFLRIWEQELSFTPGQEVTLGNTGIKVTIQLPGDAHIGDYWQIAVRPASPNEIYPHRLESFQPPDGDRIWVCPLAVVNWNDGTLNILKDCRNRFDNLVELTKRKSGGGCCNVVVKPEDLNQNTSLQSIIDRFADLNRPNQDHITICLMPGIYELPASLKLGPQHSNITIEGCGDGAEIRANPTQLTNFLDGLIVLSYADYVTFRNLRFQLPIVPFSQANGRLISLSNLQKVSSFSSKKFQQTLRVSIGIRPLHCALLSVQNCLFRFETKETRNLFAVGIFAGSECWGLQLIGNRFLHDEEYLLTQVTNRENELLPFLVGYLLSPSLFAGSDNQSLIVPSLLQDAVIRDNRFTGLTAAILAIADTGIVRLESNTVFQCISGFFLAPFELDNKLISQRAFLGILFPLPKFFDSSKLTRKLEGDIQEIQGFDRLSLSLHVLANDINSQVTIETQITNDRSSPILSGSSLVIAGNKRNPDSTIRTTSSAIVTANKFRNNHNSEQVEQQVSAATVSISNINHCTISGNLILNEAPSGKAIDVVPDVSAIAITGNIFQGAVNLPERRNDLGDPFNTWKFLNTVI